MAISLAKGQKVDLTKGQPGLQTIMVGLGWDEADSGDEDIDECCVYFANESLYGIEHGGDNLTGEGEGDDEVIEINLSKIPSNVHKIVVFMNIFGAESRDQSFADLKNSFIRLCNSKNNNEEICRFEMNDVNPSATALIAGAIYRYNGEWKFGAIGEALEACTYTEDVISRYGFED